MIFFLNVFKYAFTAVLEVKIFASICFTILIGSHIKLSFAKPKSDYNSYQSWVYRQAQQCPNGICIKPLYHKTNAYGNVEEVGPVFVGGSFDFDLAQLAHLIGPMYNLLKNSEIIKVASDEGEESKEAAKETIKESESTNQPVISFGMPEIQFVNPSSIPVRAIRKPDIYQMMDSQQNNMQIKPARRKLKRRKKPNKSKIPSLITIVDDDDDDDHVKKISNEEDDQDTGSDGGEKDNDKKELEQLLESGISGLIMEDVFGFGRGLFRPARLLTQLAFGTIARRVMKKVFKSMFSRMIPRKARLS